LAGRLEGRRLGHHHLPRGARHREPGAVRGGHDGRRGQVGPHLARHASRDPPDDHPPAHLALGRRADGRIRAAHPAARRRRRRCGRGTRHVRLLPGRHQRRLGLRRGRGPGEGRRLAAARPGREQARTPVRRRRGLPQIMSTRTHTESLTVPRRARRRSSPNRPAWEGPPTVLGQTGKSVALILVALAVLFPLYTVVLTSVSSNATVNAAGGMVVVPGEITFSAYRQILSGGIVTRSVVVSVIITAVGTILSPVVSILAAYGRSRPHSLFHRTILFACLVTMF